MYPTTPSIIIPLAAMIGDAKTILKTTSPIVKGVVDSLNGFAYPTEPPIRALVTTPKVVIRSAISLFGSVTKQYTSRNVCVNIFCLAIEIQMIRDTELMTRV